MSNKNEYFSIELKVADREKCSTFLQQFTKAMAEESLVGDGAFEVIACGWDDKCGSMTACDAYEQELVLNGFNPKRVIEDFLDSEEEDNHDR